MKTIHYASPDSPFLPPTYQQLAAILAARDTHIVSLNLKNSELEQTIILLQEQIRILQVQPFISSSESHLGEPATLDEQKAFDDEIARAEDANRDAVPEAIVDIENPVSTEEKINPKPPSKTTPPAAKKKPVRRPLPVHLEREEIRIPHRETCEICSTKLRSFGEEISKKVTHIPAKVVVQHFIREKLACPCCQTITVAPFPPQIIEKGIATAELLTDIIINKFELHLPLHRQRIIYSRLGLDIPSSTMCGWVNQIGLALFPLAERQKQVLFTQPVIHVDETPLLLFDKVDGKKIPVNGYIWAYTSTQFNEQQIIHFDCAKGQGSEFPITMLECFEGVIVTDNYSGYDAVLKEYKHIQSSACLTHVRRKFTDIIRPGTECKEADHFVSQVTKLYRLEALLKSKTDKYRHTMRNRIARPIVEALEGWIDTALEKALVGSAVYKALKHAQNRWPSIKTYLTAGNIPIDNNTVERSIRPIALGRKNWLFSGSVEAGKHMVGIMSLIATAKANGLDPAAWLLDTLKKLPTWKQSRLDELLPFAKK